MGHGFHFFFFSFSRRTHGVGYLLRGNSAKVIGRVTYANEHTAVVTRVSILKHRAFEFRGWKPWLF